MVNEPKDRDTLDGLLRFLMDHAEPYSVIAGHYRVVDLIADLASLAIVFEQPRVN